MANYALLSQTDNERFSSSEPADVLLQLKPDQQRRAKLQLGTTDPDDLLDQEDFLVGRAKRLAEELNQFLGLP